VTGRSWSGERLSLRKIIAAILNDRRLVSTFNG
jgi:hypothetical protein